MNPLILKLILHIGTVIKTVKDTEHGVEDVIAGKLTVADIETLLNDIVELVKAGVITIPGVTVEEFTKIIADIEAAI
ncbi:MAG: hypothetical protein C5B47_00270 [Verrucomicrobia bacterium]|nr:MAG: hypothetical protein C5B47_00270 [Verrucomicrobiota bacterium]